MRKVLSILLLIIIVNYGVNAQWRKVLEAPYSNLTEVSYVNKNLIFISGNDGKLLKTTNGGDSWNHLNTGVAANLVGVKNFNENIIYALGKNKIFIKSTDGGSSFLSDSLEEGIGDAMKMFFIDENVGYILTYGSGSSRLLKTNDAGLNWRIVLNIPYVLKTMYFKDAEHGCVAGGNSTKLNLYYTKDGENFLKGLNPSLGQFSYSRLDINTIEMSDSNIVYASGWGSNYLSLQPTLFLKSTNGGESWIYLEQSIENRTYETVRSLTFKDNYNGLAVGGSSRGALVLKTTDGGLNWIPQYTPIGCILYNIHSLNDSLWIIGDGGFIAKSNDFFNTFEIKSLVPLTGLSSMKWVNKNVAFVGGLGGLLLKTTNKGINWNNSYIYVDSMATNINSIYFVNENVGYTAQNYGLASKTTDGGNNWFSVLPPITNISNCIDVFFYDENTGFIIGKDEQGNLIYKTTDGGLTFDKKIISSIYPFNSIDFKDNKGVIVGQNTLGLYTTNMGETWDSSSFFGAPSLINLIKVKFITDDIVLAIGDGGFIFKSIDGGKIFNFVPNSLSRVNLSGLSFSNSDSIYILGRSLVDYEKNNYLLLSTNLGDTWVNIIDTNVISYKYTIMGIETDFNNKVWMYGNFSSIFTNADQVSFFENEINNNNFQLAQNYPNPFNPITTINFNLNKGSQVELIIYDVLGNKVIELLNDYREAGSHKIKFDASKLSSGIYFYTLKAENKITTKKMTLLK